MRRTNSTQIPHVDSFLRAARLTVLLVGCSKQANFILDPSTLPNDAYIALNNPRQIIRGFGGVNMPGWIDDNGGVTKRGYVMSQYARFVRPGYVRINATAMPQRDVFVTAYQGGSTAVIVALNHSGSALVQPFYVQSGALASVVPYVTSDTKTAPGGAPFRLPAADSPRRWSQGA